MRRIYILNIEEIHHVARQELILAGLNLKRREKVLRCRREEDRLRSMAAAALLQYGVGRWLEEQHSSLWENVSWERLEEYFPDHVPSLDIHEGAHGKPYLEGMPVHFNLSHSGNMVLCGISDRPIGVDIQKQEAGSHERLWNRYFKGQEKELLNCCTSKEEQEAMFYRLWTQKEAYGKLTGEGLTGEQVLEISPMYESRSLGICLEEHIPAPGYCAAVCWYAAYPA